MSSARRRRAATVSPASARPNMKSFMMMPSVRDRGARVGKTDHGVRGDALADVDRHRTNGDKVQDGAERVGVLYEVGELGQCAVPVLDQMREDDHSGGRVDTH